MSHETNQDRSTNPLIEVLVKIRSSFIAFIVSLGVLLIAIGLVLNGPISGILVVLGLSAFAYAVLGELALRAIGYK
jgi:uncharacterized membrane protein